MYTEDEQRSIAKAEELSATACHNQSAKAPVHDREFMKILEAHSIPGTIGKGITIPLLKAWNQGFQKGALKISEELWRQAQAP